jgi:hypothetical protein
MPGTKIIRTPRGKGLPLRRHVDDEAEHPGHIAWVASRVYTAIRCEVYRGHRIAGGPGNQRKVECVICSLSWGTQTYWDGTDAEPAMAYARRVLAAWDAATDEGPKRSRHEAPPRRILAGDGGF